MMVQTWVAAIAAEMNAEMKHVKMVISLLEEGNTVPFIARYRKEKTGGMDEVAILTIEDKLKHFKEIEKRQQFIIKAIEAAGGMTSILKELILKAVTLEELEDIYLPFKKDRKTRAEIAKEAGLEPLASIILKQREFDIEYRARDFVKGEIKSTEQALAGARDIIAEKINQDIQIRNIARDIFKKQAVVYCKVRKNKETTGIKYQDYFSYAEPIQKISAHRILAILRGEKEGFLKLSVEPDWENVKIPIERKYVEKNNSCGKQIKLAVEDCWKRLLQPAMESEMKQLLKTKADEDSIAVFALNLKQLLLSSPLGQKRVMAVDPGIRTGCKVACLDAMGNLLSYTVIFPQSHADNSVKEVKALFSKHQIECIAVGSGTAGRETEAFFRNIDWGAKPPEIYLVNEDGASIYSASEIARKEFPSLDLSYRSAVSIGRRLMDPLSELVKIDPKSIGVGQYQHDVNQQRLKEQLDRVVTSCVNQVGVNLNIASSNLLQHVSGLGPVLAENIVEFRKENGNFMRREDLKKVPRMGAKSFEQCAGFLRIAGGENPLDNSAVHPERYTLVAQMAKSVNMSLNELVANKKAISAIDKTKFVNEDLGMSSIEEILEELARPGLDPRTTLKEFSFDERVKSPEDLVVGMRLPGIVSNLTNFGAFVNIGVKQDGLIHISQITDKFIQSPADVLHINQQVTVRVTEVDLGRKRIALSLKDI